MLADLASSLAARDPSTAAHCARVTFLAGRFAMWLGWDERELCALEAGASVHDIGKVTLSQELLAKRGPLHAHELEEIRTHPEAGAKLIDSVGPGRDVLPYVLYHHERWDGSGYPTGLSGTDIPAGARLLAVADAFDAMTSTRPYRQALPISRALLEVKRCAGSQFDPMLAAAFLDAWDAGFLETPAAAVS